MDRRVSSQLAIRLSILVIALILVFMVGTALFMPGAVSPIELVVSVVIMAAITFPVVRWLLIRDLDPIWRCQEVTNSLLERWGFRPEKGDDVNDLRDRLLRFASYSQERVQALESERAKVGAVLDSMVEGVIALDRQGLVILMNPSARRILDLGRETVEGQSLLEVIRNRGLAELVEMCQTLEPNEQCRREVEMQLPVHRILEVNAMPLPLSQGIVLVFHDISELRHLEQVRAEFVANVSHELRTPLTAIKGYLETLLDETPAEPSTHRRFLEVAYTHADRLGRLLKDLLNLSDIETGKVVLHTRSVGLFEFVNEVSAIFEKEAGKKGIVLQNEVPGDTMVWADRDRLSQILVNLVDNALKYTPNGGAVTFRAIEKEHGFIGFQVIDTGQGIPPSDLPRITERFYRVDKARSREMGGTGLGLAIVKHLVQLHGGTIHIDSKVGKGTTIEIALPVQAQLSPTA